MSHLVTLSHWREELMKSERSQRYRKYNIRQMNYLDERSGRWLILEGYHNPSSKHDQNPATAFPKCKTSHNLPSFFSKMLLCSGRQPEDICWVSETAETYCLPKDREGLRTSGLKHWWTQLKVLSSQFDSWRRFSVATTKSSSRSSWSGIVTQGTIIARHPLAPYFFTLHLSQACYSHVLPWQLLYGGEAEQ